MRRLLKTIFCTAAVGAFAMIWAAASYAEGVERIAQENSADTLQLSLDEALKIALSESLTVQIADMEIEKTGYDKKISYAALFPDVNFSATYQRTIKKQTMSMTMGGQSQSIKVGMDNTYNAGFSASMPIVNFALWKSLDISAKSVELAVEQSKQSRQDLVNQVETAFYACLLAHDAYEVYKENYLNARETYEQTKAKYESGRVAKYDMIRAEVNMQNAEPNMYDAQNSMVLATWQLKALIGMDLNQEIKCKGSLDDYISKFKDVSIAGNEIYVENNSQLKQLAIQSEILTDTYKAKVAQFYPSLAGTVSYSWIAMNNNFKFNHYKWNPYSVAGLTLAIPIFSGGERYYGLKQTKLQQKQLALQQENARRGLVVAAKSNLNSMETALKQYNAAIATVDGAQTGFDIAKKRYEIGSGTILDMNDAQLALLQAKLNVKNSIYQYLVAKSALDLTLGNNKN